MNNLIVYANCNYITELIIEKEIQSRRRLIFIA